MADNELSGKKIVLGISGSIAAYKAADIASQLVGLGADVQVAMTPSATKFLGPITLRSLTGRTPLVDTFDELEEGRVAHISVIENADLLLLAPATGNLIGKVACGIADDMLTTLTMAATCPVVLAPAMNSHMWTNPIVIYNVDRLKNLDYKFVEPVEGRLACGMVGIGKMAPVEQIIETVKHILAGDQLKDLNGVPVLVTAGPTREPIDPVRFLSNYSSGKMGFAIAESAMHRGAKVTLVTGPSEMEPPSVDNVVRVQTAAEMLEAVRSHYKDCRVVISAAAVSDFSPRKASQKLKKADMEKSSRTIELQETTDILAELGKEKGNKVLVGFALETQDLEKNAKAKLKAKNLDMVVANSAAEGNEPFGNGPSRVRIITRDGEDHAWPLMSKQEIADHMLSFIKDKFLANTENNQ